LKSIPIVAKWFFKNLFSTNLLNTHVLPTPLSPIVKILNVMVGSDVIFINNYKIIKKILIDDLKFI
jgi:hypothetical protein